jgi:thiol-disulfide isomerase/thioredoxin
MAINKKTKTKVRTGAIILIVAITLFIITQQKIEIIYFTNPNCQLVDNTDRILQDIEEKFRNKVSVREIKVNMYENDTPDTKEIKQLRERYEVHGVPEIIINGKEFTKQFTYYELEKAICDQFIIKPSACL